MRLLYRADGGRDIGTGHILRAVRVIAQMPGAVRAHAVLAVAEDDVALRLARQASCQVGILPSRPETGIKPRFDAEVLMRSVDVSSFDCVVVDMLDTRAGQLAALARVCPTVVTMDDRGPGRREAHAILNVLVREPEPGSLPPGTELFEGPAYATLGPEYAAASAPRSPGDARSVVVSLGGADAAGLSLKVARALRRVRGIERVTFVCGLAFAHIERLNQECAGAAWAVSVLRNAPTLRDSLLAADIGIVAGGFTMYEACRVGLPSVALCQPIDHQIELAAELAGLGAMMSLGDGTQCPDERISEAVTGLLGDAPARRRMSACGPAIVDGQGTLRTARLLQDVSGVRGEEGRRTWKN